MTAQIDHGPLQLRAIREALKHFQGTNATSAEKAKWIADRVAELAGRYQPHQTKARVGQAELFDPKMAAAGKDSE